MGISMGPLLYTVRTVQVGVDFGVLGVDLSPSYVVMLWLRLQQASNLSHVHI
jgi:hypothetical protein